MGIDDRDYMRTSRGVGRASDQRRPGDPRRAADVFLPGTVHASPPRRGRKVLAIVCVVVAVAVMAVAFSAMAHAAGPASGDAVALQLPRGHVVLGSARMRTHRPGRDLMIVATGRGGETMETARRDGGAARPLLVFERQGGRATLIGRNDHVVLHADEGGQCDPFLDSGGTIEVHGRTFTVVNGVACGQHWSDEVTFRVDPRLGVVFDHERVEYWKLNEDARPGADAMVRDGPPRVTRDRKGRVTAFRAWRRPGEHQ